MDEGQKDGDLYKEIKHLVSLQAETLKTLGKVSARLAPIVIALLEHAAVGGARVIDPVKANDPSIPCTCFVHEEEDYCWKKGYLGLISPKHNPEQMATCQIKNPASGEAQERFVKFKTAISEAHERWEEKKGGLPEWWEEVGKSLESHGLEI